MFTSSAMLLGFLAVAAASASAGSFLSQHRLLDQHTDGMHHGMTDHGKHMDGMQDNMTDPTAEPGPEDAMGKVTCDSLPSEALCAGDTYPLYITEDLARAASMSNASHMMAQGSCAMFMPGSAEEMTEMVQSGCPDDALHMSRVGDLPIGPFCYHGDYPLYKSSASAKAASPAFAYHEHAFGDFRFFMPNGVHNQMASMSGYEQPCPDGSFDADDLLDCTAENPCEPFAPPSPSPSPPKPESGDDGLSTGAIVGIVVGAVAGVVLIAATVYVIAKRNLSRAKKPSARTATETAQAATPKAEPPLEESAEAAETEFKTAEDAAKEQLPGAADIDKV